jgi:hypothetical protein
VLSVLKKNDFETWDKAAREEVAEIEKAVINPEYEHSVHELESWQEHYYDQQILWKTSLQRVERLKSLFETSKRFATNYALVLIVSCLALIDPSLASSIISVFNFE